MFRIDLLLTDRPDRKLLTKILYRAVVEGVRYNTNPYLGSYRIVPSDPAEEIHVDASGETEKTEELVEAVDRYVMFDPRSTELGITVSYTAVDPPLICRIAVKPVEHENYILEFEARPSQIEDRDRFRSFLQLPWSIFDRFDFPYGASRIGEQEPIPTDIKSATETEVRLATFYSAALADDIGLSRIRSAPTVLTTESEDGGLFLLACDNPRGCLQETNKLEYHLMRNK